MSRWYDVNWTKTRIGNGIREGNTLMISIPKASHISGAIYKNNVPVLAIFGHGTKARIKVQRKGRSLKGLCVLKIRGADRRNRGFGVDDAFIVF